MFKPATNVCLGHQRQGFRQRVSEFSLGPSLEGAKGSLELGDTALNGIEVGGVCGEMLDVQRKDLSINRPFNQQRGANSLHYQGGDHREIAPVVKRFGHLHSLAARGPGVGTGQGQVEAEFVQEDQGFTPQRPLALLERGALLGVGLGGALGLFFRVSPSACNPRQIVLRLTATRAFFRSCSLSSARVASGIAATQSGNCLRCSSESFALAPPPWGNGAISPRSRFWRNSL